MATIILIQLEIFSNKLLIEFSILLLLLEKTTEQRFISMAQYLFTLNNSKTTLLLCLMTRITGAWDYFHVIVLVPGRVTHQMPNPVVSQSPGPKHAVTGQSWPETTLALEPAGKQQREVSQQMVASRINKWNLITLRYNCHQATPVTGVFLLSAWVICSPPPAPAQNQRPTPIGLIRLLTIGVDSLLTP